MKNEIYLVTTEIKNKVFVSVEDVVNYLKKSAENCSDKSTKDVLLDLSILFNSLS